ncbi:Crp/Fnr family transcriptional regulator [Novosphingobium sp. M1R2S20]|uniref:Crp/Fnr family transcriptional regulator n=1 Tax=Novosphingobium rhizovicinum TaxID=3228928 RepID=A0ABV3RF71_9SPHN
MTATMNLERAGTSPAARSAHSCSDCPVRDVSFCAGLDEEERSAFTAMRRQKQLLPGEALAWQDEESPFLAVVREGIVKNTVMDANGGEQTVGISRSGDFVGRPFSGPTPYGISAVGPVELCVFPRNDFDRLANERQGVGHHMLKVTLDELQRTRRWLLMLGKKSATQKVSAFILEFARNGRDLADDEACVVELPFGRQEIADILGLTIETVSREFTGLRRHGVIDLPSRRSVAVKDLAALADASGEVTYN